MQKKIISLVIIASVTTCFAYFMYFIYSKEGMNKLNKPTLSETLSNNVLIEEISPSATPVSDEPYKLKAEYQLDTVDDNKALGYTGQQKIAVDSFGNIYTTYRKKYKGNFEIFVTKLSKLSSGKYLVSGNTGPISIVGKDATQRVSSIAISQNDVISVTWYGLDPNDESLGRQIKYSQSRDGGKTWTKWRNITIVHGYDGEDYWQEHPQATLYNNYVYIVWEGKDSNNDQQQIKFSRSTDRGVTFSTWKNVQPTPQNTQSRPSTLVDGNGWLHLFMYSSQSVDNDVQQIWHSLSKDNGDTWFAWENVSGFKLDARHVSAVVDESRIMAVWRQQVGKDGPSQLFYSIYNDLFWSEPKTISSSKNYQMFPILGLSKGGIFVTWVETPDSSDFPRDNPKGALGYVSYYQQSTQMFTQPLSLSSKQDILYPHATTSDLDSVYLVYEKETAENYGIFFNILTTK